MFVRSISEFKCDKCKSINYVDLTLPTDWTYGEYTHYKCWKCEAVENFDPQENWSIKVIQDGKPNYRPNGGDRCLDYLLT